MIIKNDMGYYFTKTLNWFCWCFCENTTSHYWARHLMTKEIQMYQNSRAFQVLPSSNVWSPFSGIKLVWLIRNTSDFPSFLTETKLWPWLDIVRVHQLGESITMKIISWTHLYLYKDCLYLNLLKAHLNSHMNRTALCTTFSLLQPQQNLVK